MSDENYSKLVLSQLESLSSAVEALRTDLQFVRHEIVELKAREDKVTEIKNWKERINEVVSPPQLEKLVNEVEVLNDFKTKAITIFAVVQFAMGAILFAMNFLG